jgi:D-tyrosyl-tRNA(Tyr) deacylase
MRAVVQRVSSGWVQVEEQQKRPIGNGLVVLIGVGKDDNDSDARYIADKILNLRIFPDQDGKFDYSVIRSIGCC